MSVVEPYVVEDYVIESGRFSGSRRVILAVPREQRVVGVQAEQRIVTVDREHRTVGERR